MTQVCIKIDVFDAAMSLYIKLFELTVHQRLTRALSMSDLEVDEKPSQWMARRGRVGPRRCRALGSPTPFASVITHYTGAAYTATINGRVVAKGRHTVCHAALRDCFRHRGNTNRTSGGRHRGRPPGRQCIVQETRRTWRQWRQEEETTTMLVPCQIRR